MSTSWQATGLSTSPPSIPMADTDRRAITFRAGETITTATATLVDLGTGTAVTEPVESVTPAADSVTVTISGLTRGNSYELSVVFTRADGTRWTRVLVIRVVA